MRYWWENSHWGITNNMQETNKVDYQPGGAALVFMNWLLHQAQRPCDDKVGLGWWCWAWLRGKTNKIIQIVSAYRPCKLDVVLTTYQQQVWVGAKQKIWTCPRKWLQELSQEILQLMEVGDKVIILADMNEDVLAKDIAQFCKAMNLVEAIHSLHGPSPVPTHQWGSKAINGIFLTKTLLNNIQGGFFPSAKPL